MNLKLEDLAHELNQTTVDNVEFEQEQLFFVQRVQAYALLHIAQELRLLNAQLEAAGKGDDDAGT